MLRATRRRGNSVATSPIFVIISVYEMCPGDWLCSEVLDFLRNEEQCD